MRDVTSRMSYQQTRCVRSIAEFERRKRKPLAAVTLMETIFAIGVVMTGLLGLAALIPVAANNAQATMELDRSISESTSAAAAGRAKEYNDTSSLVIFDEPVTLSSARVGSITAPYGYEPTGTLQSIRSKLSVQEFGTSGLVLGKLESPGYGHMDLGTGLSSGICLDPLGLPSVVYRDPAGIRTAANAAAYDSAFVPSRFPYYSERYNVLTPPNESVAGGASPNWPMSPRMWRATLRAPMHPHPIAATIPTATPPAIRRNELISPGAARFQFRGSGGISAIDGQEEGTPASLLFSSSRSGNSFIDVRANASSDYSWFATLVPSFTGGNTFRQSIVVVRKRVAPVPQRQSDPLALREASHTINDADENPASERLCWVGNWVGFDGGAGGEVEIIGSQSISNDIKTNEWVMLSRQPWRLVASVPNVPFGPAVHRWYRVLRVEDPVEQASFTMPGGPTTNVWSRWVTLAGPDWAFQDESVSTTPVDDTFCTIVTGAVSVVESEVTLQ